MGKQSVEGLVDERREDGVGLVEGEPHGHWVRNGHAPDSRRLRRCDAVGRVLERDGIVGLGAQRGERGEVEVRAGVSRGGGRR